MRVAFVHDWLVSYRGGERVLEALLQLYPDAPIYTLFYDKDAMPKSIQDRDVRVDPGLNFFRRFRKILLPLLPAAIESLPLDQYELVISTSSCVAKGVMVGPNAKHLCYIHSPMRYIWDQRFHYFAPRSLISPKNFLTNLLSHRLRIWDASVNQRVDVFVANSQFVRKRVKRYYGRDASVIYPPVDVARFVKTAWRTKDQKYMLAAGAFVSYKRFDLAIAACERLGMKIIVAGGGPDENKLRRIAGKHTTFMIAPSHEKWVELFQGAEAFLFPGVEDFGITAIEAMAAGVPVIAYEAGGALDFIKPGMTGQFFREPTVESLASAIENFDPKMFDSENLQKFAYEFSKDNFLTNIKKELKDLIGEMS